jgi:asparagine synthase (glutamine-hydrolysing)
MAGALSHRGPDGYGLYLDDACGLAHTRLSIIDLAGGAQPLCNEDGTIWIVYNGEIFNYVELRADLERAGHRFRTRSDTEVIVHAYEEWGHDCWRRFNGQFAAALRDARDGSLCLARDRVGIVPLFWARSGDALVFGSEAKAIFASGRVRAAPDNAALAGVFTFWSAVGPSTVFAGVRTVPPGSVVSFDRGLRECHRTYHSLRFARPGDCFTGSAHEACEELRGLLRRAVGLRLRADVPVGAYLSGGVDSSVITRLVTLEDSSPLQTFSLRFADQRYDEGEAQRRMSRVLGAQHHEIVATPELLREELARTVRHSETPLLRTAPVPMFLLSSLVRTLGMKVVLTGEGADEFLGGYDVFAEDKIRRFWARSPTSSIRPLLLGRVHPYVANATGGMWQAFFSRGMSETDHPYYSHRLRWENTAWSLRFLSPEIRDRSGDSERDAALETALPEGWRGADPTSRAQHLEIATFMTPYLLASQGDRALMANGVEGRFPYLDPDVIAFCARLPPWLKICGLRQKVVLRDMAASLLPPEAAERRKWPFRAPASSALFGPDAPDFVRELLSEKGLAGCPLIDARSAAPLCLKAWRHGAQLGEREEMALIGLLTLQIWYRDFIAPPSIRSGPADGAPARQVPLVFVDARSDRGAGPGRPRV